MVKYEIKDRFGCKHKVKSTFKTFQSAQKMALKVYKVENNTGGGSAKLLSWGSNK